MLQEILPLKQLKDEPFRRWFEDEFFDLIVWYDESDEIFAFQLCYQKSQDEHALAWLVGKGYDHYRIDTGERSVWETMAPLLRAGGMFPREQVVEKFRERSIGIEPHVVQFVLQKIDAYG